jgi:hypothetical protein
LASKLPHIHHVIARLSRRVVVMVMMLMSLVMLTTLVAMVIMIVVRVVMVTIAQAVGIAIRGDSDRGILLPATPNAAKLAR